MIDLAIKVPDVASLKRVKDAMEDRSMLNAVIAADAKALTQRHIAREGQQRHTTADRLGAKPTGAIEKAKVTSDSDGEGASVTIEGNAFARTFKRVSILPINARCLTIPRDAEAYGKRVKELEGEGWEFFTPKGADRTDEPLLFGRSPSGETKPMYILARSATLEQDRSLLPSDEEYEQVALDAMQELVDRELFNRGFTT